VSDAFERRVAPLQALGECAEALALACRDMAARFTTGGRLLVFGDGIGATDAAHVAVEFVHPVTVGKRALPALALTGEAFAHQVRTLGRPADIVVGFCGTGSPSVAAGLQAARSAGMLTVALTGSGGECQADHCLTIASGDPLVVKEGHVTAYHLLWELVHVFFDSPEGGAQGAKPGDMSGPPSGPPSGVEQLYPFLYGGGTSAQPVLDAAAESARQKVAEIVALRREVGSAQGAALASCAAELAAAFASGATLYAFGNGGSSTDAHAVTHAFLNPSPPAIPLPALCLAGDVAVLTALSNDVGFDVTFSRQIRAFGRPGDIAIGISTSGGSPNVLAGIEEAHRAGMRTVGLSGYGGGRMAELAALDHLFAVPSSSVHRVQEVQTSLYNVLWEETQAALASGRLGARG
jgi:D-sedoheptulose 7-phosphate isomerase